MQIGKDIVWDFPRDFEIKELHFGHWADRNNISELVREYIDTPLDELLQKEFTNELLVIDTSPMQDGTEKKYEVIYHLTELFITLDRE